MIPLDVVSSGVDKVSNGWCVVIFSEGLEMLSFSIMKPSFSFTNVKIFTIVTTGFVNNFRLLRTIVRKKIFDVKLCLERKPCACQKLGAAQNLLMPHPKDWQGPGRQMLLSGPEGGGGGGRRIAGIDWYTRIELTWADLPFWAFRFLSCFHCFCWFIIAVLWFIYI